MPSTQCSLSELWFAREQMRLSTRDVVCTVDARCGRCMLQPHLAALLVLPVIAQVQADQALQALSIAQAACQLQLTVAQQAAPNLGCV